MNWEELTPEQQKEVYEKCKESPAYFYNNFIRKEGEREWTDEEIESLRRSWVVKRRTPHMSTPILPKDCYPPGFKIISNE